MRMLYRWRRPGEKRVVRSLERELQIVEPLDLGAGT